MYQAKYIIPGLIVFAALVLFPFVFNAGSTPFEVKLELPKNASECIEAKEVMRARHMQILDEWRDKVVRDGVHVYENSKGQKFDISLTNTCMECHTDKAKFCDRCHDPVGVSPYCWDCHNLSPKQAGPIPPVSQEAGGH
jgi:hypothetical protein